MKRRSRMPIYVCALKSSQHFSDAVLIKNLSWLLGIERFIKDFEFEMRKYVISASQRWALESEGFSAQTCWILCSQLHLCKPVRGQTQIITYTIRNYSNCINFSWIAPDMAQGGETSHKVKTCLQYCTTERVGANPLLRKLMATLSSAPTGTACLFYLSWFQPWNPACCLFLQVRGSQPGCARAVSSGLVSLKSV